MRWSITEGGAVRLCERMMMMLIESEQLEYDAYVLASLKNHNVYKS